jgi:ribosome-binding factor A
VAADRNQRRSRVGSEIQRVLSALIVREVKDPRVGNITVTEVKVSPDLSEARVYVVPFGGGRSAAESEEIIAGLTHAAGFLRGAVGRALGLRHAPRLQFVLDEQIDRAANLSRLIDSAVDEDRQSHPRDDTEPV